jgi:hypothetical protein
MTSAWVFPRPPSLPDNPVTAERKGWWDAGIFAGVRFEPRNWEEAIAADPSLAHALGVPTSRNRVVKVAQREYAFRADINAIAEITLAERIDARDFQSGMLIVHFDRAPAWTGADAAIQIAVVNTAAASEEPATPFIGTGDIASIVISSGTLAPLLRSAALSTPIAAELRVVLRWLQGPTTSTAEERFALAVDLVGQY